MHGRMGLTFSEPKFLQFGDADDDDDDDETTF